MKILKYELSNDKIGLLAYFTNKNFYHIHSNELSPKEKKILNELKNQ